MLASGGASLEGTSRQVLEQSGPPEASDDPNILFSFCFFRFYFFFSGLNLL